MTAVETLSIDMLDMVSGGESDLIVVDVSDCKKHPWYYSMCLGKAILMKFHGYTREEAIKALIEEFRTSFYSEILNVDKIVTQEAWDSWKK